MLTAGSSFRNAVQVWTYIFDLIFFVPIFYLLNACGAFEISGADSVLMMVGDTDIEDWDARKYPRCKPFRGQKGIAWEKFLQDFGTAISEEMDTDSDWEQTLLGKDIGGAEWLAAGNGPASAAQKTRHDQRNKKVYTQLYRHVADHRLREMIDTGAKGDGHAAYKLINQQCRRVITDLELSTLDKEWDNCSITSSIGVKIDSIILFARLLTGLNARRPTASRKDDDELTKKLLLQFTPNLCAVLAMEAHKELRADQFAVRI